MFIRVLQEGNEELIINANCQTEFLLYHIKKVLNIPQSEVIDLCNTDGEVKHLYKFNKLLATKFFTLRELCLVVYVQDPLNKPYFIPILEDYRNEDFEAKLNHKDLSGKERSGKSSRKNSPKKNSYPRFVSVGTEKSPPTSAGSRCKKKKNS